MEFGALRGEHTREEDRVGLGTLSHNYNCSSGEQIGKTNRENGSRKEMEEETVESGE